MIAESKQRKQTARREREETLEVTDRLDDGFEEVMQIFCKSDLVCEWPGRGRGGGGTLKSSMICFVLLVCVLSTHI